VIALIHATGFSHQLATQLKIKPCYGLQSVVDDAETERRLQSANFWRVGLLPDRLKNFLGTAGAVPYKLTPNKFGAQKSPSSTTG